MNPTLSLAGKWRFQIDSRDAGLRERWQLDASRSTAWKSIDVPGYFEQHGFDGDQNIGWYQRVFEIPEKIPPGRLGLAFSGINAAAQVWLNGKQLAALANESDRFVADATTTLLLGANVVTVRVPDHGAPGGIMIGAWLTEYENVADLACGRYAVHPARRSADWVRDAVVYEVYLRSFSAEGTFVGLEKRLDELKALGVSVLWLMPIHPVGVEKRKGALGSPYAIRDFYGINPEFGTLSDFRRLLDAAHRRGLRLILDLVANHTSWDNPLIAEHPEWYRRDERGALVSPLDWTDVAQLDYNVPELRRYMIEMMLYWMRDIGIDGFRCDVTGLVANEFWSEARPRLDAVKDVIMIAEDDAPRQHVQAFDLTYDWWTYQALGRLASGKMNPTSLAAILANERLDYPADSLRLRFSDNHDLCAWHKPGMARYGPAAARAAAVLTFTLPGVPLIYNGQEAGNRTALPLFERLPIDWTADDQGMRALFIALCQIRADSSALRRGKIEFLTTGIDTDVLAFKRIGAEETLLVLINCGLEPRNVDWNKQNLGPPRLLLASTSYNSNSNRALLPPLGYWVGRCP